jgi:hypothetical protein
MAENTARLSEYLYDDSVVAVSASGVQNVYPGEWMIYSGQWAIPAHDAIIGSPAYRVSAIGVALDWNPAFDGEGFVNNSGLTVLTRGIMRVSAADSATAGTMILGSYCYPDLTGSAMYGHTGVTGGTGLGPLWATAAPVAASGATGATPSGIAQLIAQVKAGDASAGQIDIRWNLSTNWGYY